MIFLLIFASLATNIMADGDNVGLRAVAESTGQFSNNFWKTIASENHGNLIASPLSAQIVLVMAAYGAGGRTAVQMRSTLALPLDDNLGQSGYRSLIETLRATEGVELRLANKIYTASDLQINPSYKELTATKFYSSSEEVDFRNSVAAAKTMNAWCEQQTNNRIKDVITPDSLDGDTKLVLLNAVYFKGRWKVTFDDTFTRDRAFQVDKQTTKTVSTMFLSNKFLHGNLPELNARFIEIPYQGNEFSMVIILPNEVDGLKAVENNLHKLNLSQILQQASFTDVELFLPKFKIESTLELNRPLQKMGLTDMFENSANFSGISNAPLKVSQVIQKAFIEVNEEGSEAAAVTELKIMTYSAWSSKEDPVIFSVDRPFYYVIYHGSTNTPLFTGSINEPRVA